MTSTVIECSFFSRNVKENTNCFGVDLFQGLLPSTVLTLEE